MPAKKPSVSKTPDSTKVLLGIAILLIAIMILGAGFFLGTRHTTVSQLTPTVFPAASPTTAEELTSQPTKTMTFISSGPNPASAFCSQQGGTLAIQTRGDGGQYGLCNFDDGYACEEWAMFRGECPIGGVRTTGFDTIEQKYCAWGGGSTLAEADATCTFSNGSTCSDLAYYNGTCSKTN